MHPALILASGSAIRLSLLRESGLDVVPRPIPLDEGALRDDLTVRGKGAGAIAQALAHAKAAAAFAGGYVAEAGAFVIAADQILELDGAIITKPKDMAAARRQLLALRDRTHVLQTAVTLFRDGHPLWSHLEAPRLTMRAFSEAFLDAYLQREGTCLLACVGAYRLEGPGVQLFSVIDGQHDAILGLPRLPLLAALREAGAIPS